MARISMNDIQRLAKEIGVEYNEAASLLQRTGGNYRRAVRLHQEAFTIYVEPVLVEDAPRSRRQMLADGLRSAWKSVCSARINGRRMKMMLAAAAVIAACAALIAAPQVTGALMLGLMLLRICLSLRTLFSARAAY